MEYELRQELTTLLGEGKPTARSNLAFECPFRKCPSYGTGKRKLEVNTVDGQWHCWVCNARGKTLKSLFLALDSKLSFTPTPVESGSVLQAFVGEKSSPNPIIQLPSEFIPLHLPKALGFYGKKALHYVRGRGLTEEDIVTYNLGYCEAGQYDGYIIIPNYNEVGELDYFTTRAYMPNRLKSKNPPFERRSVVGFGLQLNWSLPLVIVESAFNAMTVRYNASPLYGSNLTAGFLQKLYQKEVKEVIFCWDEDAFLKSEDFALKLLANGIKVKVVQFPIGQDANDLGHEATWSLINSTPYLTHSDLQYTQLLRSLNI